MKDIMKKLELITPDNIGSPAGQRFMMSKILEQREEILTAFIAEHGCKPSECVQVVQTHDDKIYYHVEKEEENEDIQ